MCTSAHNCTHKCTQCTLHTVHTSTHKYTHCAHCTLHTAHSTHKCTRTTISISPPLPPPPPVSSDLPVSSPLRPHQIVTIALCGYRSPLKSSIKEIMQNLILHSHFLEIALFQKEFLEIVLCLVSLLIYIWVRVNYSQLQKKDLQ